MLCLGAYAREMIMTTDLVLERMLEDKKEEVLRILRGRPRPVARPVMARVAPDSHDPTQRTSPDHSAAIPASSQKPRIPLAAC
ncbi:MAG: hypothetical protein A2X94_08680 [Bdellovibrionales bacterium GWB1_55_8]|nr:MAG: hypothetical protein A2X94_08680 [Bdellovibrionales bacterium GWB1_55_8]